MRLLEFCQDDNHDDASFECLVLDELAQMKDQIDQVSNGLDTLFMIYAGSLIFLMQAGFAMLEAGSVRAKNVKNILLKNLLDACTTAIIYFVCGYAFQFGDSNGQMSLVGNSGFFAPTLETAEDYVTFFSFYGFAATAITIVACAVAERCQIKAYLLYSIFLAGFVYPVVARSIWSEFGFLSTTVARDDDLFLKVGVIDFAGSGVVHLTGGATALVGVFMLGPRLGRFHDLAGNPLDEPHKFQQHSSALQVLGTFLLWFGWYGFNTGSTLTISTEHSPTVASLCTVTSTLAAASGGLVGLYFETWVEFRRSYEVSYDIVAALNGALSGLVAITAGCSVVEPWASVIIGGLAGIFYVWSFDLLIYLRLDDVVSAVPVHFTNGIWGLIAVGLFAEESRLELAGFPNPHHKGLFYSWGDGSGDAHRFGAQVVACFWIVGWTVCMAIPFFFVLNLCDMFRVAPEVELQGLDLATHGGIAYNLSVSRHGYKGDVGTLAAEWQAARNRASQNDDDNNDDSVDLSLPEESKEEERPYSPRNEMQQEAAVQLVASVGEH